MTGFDVFPNPAAPDDPDTAILWTEAPIPEGWETIPYHYIVIERIPE